MEREPCKTSLNGDFALSVPIVGYMVGRLILVGALLLLPAQPH